MQADRWRRGRRLLPWLLGVSLALNLLVIGAFAGAAYRHAGGPGARGEPPGVRGYGSPYVQALPREARRELGRALRGGSEGKAMSRAARRALYDEMLVALRRDPFDPAAAEAVLQAQRTAVDGVQRRAHSAWLAEIAGMDAAARADYADTLEEVLERGPRHRRISRDD